MCSELEILPQLDTRLPKWPLDQLIPRSCPLCRQTHHALFRRPDYLPVTFCSTCSLWYVCELPPEVALNEFYNNYWRTFRPRKMDKFTARQMIEASPHNFARDLRLQRLQALLGDIKNHTVLEVGCGLGMFLLTAQAKGARVIGQDISPEACDFLSEHLHIPAYRKPLVELVTEITSVDVVAMNDLIEHPVEPFELLRAAYQLLLPGGLLLIWTPNGGVAGETVDMAKNWVGFRVDQEHLQYFSAKAIVRLAGEQGWDIEHLETLGKPSLNGLGQLQRASRWFEVSRLIKKLPLTRRLWRGLRAFRTEFSDARDDMRDSTYHLFVILRKR